MEKGKIAVEFKDVNISYGESLIIKEMNLKIKKSKFTTFVGLSGSGKTTLIKSINGLIEIDSGEIEIYGKNISEISKFKKVTNAGYIIQRGGLFSHMSIIDNLLLARKPHLKRQIKNIKEKYKKSVKSLMNNSDNTDNNSDIKSEKKKLLIKYKEMINFERKNGKFSKKVFLEKIDKLFNDLSLDKNILKKIPSQLSGGQVQRIGIIRAFILDTDIILLDEPFSALDPIVKRSLQNLTYKLMKQYNKTVIMVSHDPDEIMRLSDEIVILKNGKLFKNKKWNLESVKKSKDKWIRKFFLFDTVENLKLLEEE
ncbi:MAG: ATP-binding cassette domain-containing protein [Mycoplasmatales bacterium]|nr:ATP-binding cassette domain-containing protein [Mycoplasmatales bacterium]